MKLMQSLNLGNLWIWAIFESVQFYKLWNLCNLSNLHNWCNLYNLRHWWNWIIWKICAIRNGRSEWTERTEKTKRTERTWRIGRPEKTERTEGTEGTYRTEGGWEDREGWGQKGPRWLNGQIEQRESDWIWSIWMVPLCESVAAWGTRDTNASKKSGFSYLRLTSSWHLRISSRPHWLSFGSVCVTGPPEARVIRKARERMTVFMLSCGVVMVST